MSGKLPRSRVAKIVSDLAHGRRSAAAIASRNHVSEEVVEQLRARFGPDLGEMAKAAAELRKPKPDPDAAKGAVEAGVDERTYEYCQTPIGERVHRFTCGRPGTGRRWHGREGTPVCEDCRAAEAAQKRVAAHGAAGRDGLTVDERGACRDWCRAQGVNAGLSRVPKASIDMWVAAGRPRVTAETAAELGGESDADDDPEDAEAVTVPDAAPESTPAPDTDEDADAEAVDGVDDGGHLTPGDTPIRAWSVDWPGYPVLIAVFEAIASGDVYETMAYAAQHLPTPLAEWWIRYEVLHDLVAEHRHEQAELTALRDVLRAWASEHELVLSAEQLTEAAERALWAVGG